MLNNILYYALNIRPSRGTVELVIHMGISSFVSSYYLQALGDSDGLAALRNVALTKTKRHSVQHGQIRRRVHD